MKQPITIRTLPRAKPKSNGWRIALAVLVLPPVVYAASYLIGKGFTAGALSTSKVVMLHYDEQAVTK